MPLQQTRLTIVHTLLDSTLRAGSGYSNIINTQDYAEAVFFLESTTKEGTAPRLNLTLQVSPDGVTFFNTASTFAEVSAEDKKILTSTALGKFVRFSYAITGTDTPKFTFYLKGAFKS